MAFYEQYNSFLKVSIPSTRQFEMTLNSCAIRFQFLDIKRNKKKLKWLNLICTENVNLDFVLAKNCKNVEKAVGKKRS